MYALNCFTSRFSLAAPERLVFQESPTQPAETSEAPAMPSPEAPAVPSPEAPAVPKVENAQAIMDRVEKLKADAGNPEIAKRTLEDPEKLLQLLEELNPSTLYAAADSLAKELAGDKTVEASYDVAVGTSYWVVEKMLSVVKGDGEFLKRIIEVYADKASDQYAFVCVEAIKLLEIEDEASNDEFFKRIFDRSNDSYVREEAVKKIRDEDYKLSTVLKYITSNGTTRDHNTVTVTDFHTFQERSHNFSVTREIIFTLNKPESLRRVIAAVDDRSVSMDESDKKVLKLIAEARLGEVSG